MVHFTCFLSTIEPKNIKEDVADEYCMVAIHEEMGEFVRNYIWQLILRSSDVNLIGTKWVLRTKQMIRVTSAGTRLDW